MSKRFLSVETKMIIESENLKKKKLHEHICESPFAPLEVLDRTGERLNFNILPLLTKTK